MIDKDKIISIIESHLTDNEIFIVSLSISPQNKIKLVVDKYEGIKIEECIKLSRLVESNLDRETEDFELEVTSPGIGQVFKVKEQYFKAIDKTVKIVCADGSEYSGLLKNADETKISLEVTKKVKTEGKKKKEEQIENIDLTYEQIKQTKEIIKF